MTAKSRKDRILVLIIDKVFLGSIAMDAEEELNELLDHPDENRKEWERLLNREALIDYINKNFNVGNEANLEAAKAKFFAKVNKKD